MRIWIRIIHRYVGLTLAFFLFVAALSGIFLSFNDELERAISPELFIVEVPIQNQKKLDPLLLRDKVHQFFPNIETDYAPLREGTPDQSFYMSVSAKKDFTIDFNQVFVNPYTGEILGTRMRGDLSQGAKNIMPFIYKLHYSLLLGDFGELIFGIVALIWTLDLLFIPFLTFPKKPFYKFNLWIKTWWKYSWRFRLSQFKSLNRFIYSHRSIGLWMWSILFIFALSSIYFNLGSVYKPIMHTIFTHQEANKKVETLQLNSKIDLYKARKIGRELMKEEAKKQNFKINYEDFIGYFPKRDMYEYFVNSDRDLFNNEGKTRIYFDVNTGELLSLRIPTGKASSDTITSWITVIHMAAIGGLWFQIFIALSGGIIIVLIFTGVLMWWRKRSKEK